LWDTDTDTDTVIFLGFQNLSHNFVQLSPFSYFNNFVRIVGFIESLLFAFCVLVMQDTEAVDNNHNSGFEKVFLFSLLYIFNFVYTMYYEFLFVTVFFFVVISGSSLIEARWKKCFLFWHFYLHFHRMLCLHQLQLRAADRL